MCTSVSDMLEAAVLLKEVGVLDPGVGSEPSCPIGIVPLFETIEDLQGGADTLLATLDIRSIVRSSVPVVTVKK